MVSSDGGGPTGEEFLARLKKKDSRAWEQLVEQLNQRLYNFLRRSLPEPEVPEVVQETWGAVVRAIETFDGNVSIVTFVFAIANHKVADFWRRDKPATELPETLSTSGPNESSVLLQQALALLPEQSRQVILLRYHMDFSVGEIADIIGRTYKATESLLSRARKQLQDILEEQGRDR